MPSRTTLLACAAGAGLLMLGCAAGPRSTAHPAAHPAARPTARPAVVSSAAAVTDTVLTPARLAGTWRYTLDTPAGGSGGYYVFRIRGDTLTGEVRRALPGEPGGEAPPRPMRAVALQGAVVTFTYEAGSYGALATSLRLVGADSLAGRLYVGESDLPVTAVRVR